ncbi:alpha/beta fold hydrolase [Roseateles sp. DC23W]|uniref:Alpha/beta fold hydrolase n=1 Tax=Pelomonas dachongensis TaxID=3299029 RepID=A0ABW7ER59_9BURK
MSCTPDPEPVAAGTAIVVIPGIGGHPAFHADLIRALQEAAPVLTQPHGDFFAPPWSDLQAHVAHWRAFIEQAGAQRIVLVGVSFGAQVALAVARALGRRLVGLLLISWWPIGWLERAALRALHALPPTPLQRLLGRWAFRWSELKSDDPAALRKTRTALYDNEATVQARLWARLMCCREARMALVPPIRAAVHLVYGDRELARLRATLIHTRLRALGTLHRVPGDHAVSTRASPNFENTVLRLVRQALNPAETVA